MTLEEAQACLDDWKDHGLDTGWNGGDVCSFTLYAVTGDLENFSLLVDNEWGSACAAWHSVSEYKSRSPGFIREVAERFSRGVKS